SFSAKYSYSNSALFGAGTPTVTATGFTTLAPFKNLLPDDVAGMFTNVQSWLDQLKSSSLFSPSVPFVSGLNLGDGLDFAAGFANQIYAKVADASSGAAKFASLQGLLSLLGASTTAKYDAATSSVTFPVTFTQTLSVLPGQALDLDMNLGDLI